MIVLPINSVINPVLYDSTIKEFINSTVRDVIAVIRDSRFVRFLRGFRSRFGRIDIATGGDNQIVQNELTGLEGACTEPRDLPGNAEQAAQAEQIEVADNTEEGTSPDIRELEVAAPEDIVMDTEM
jgi:hypothetical protein